MSDCECIVEAANIIAQAIYGLQFVLILGMIFGAFRN